MPSTLESEGNWCRAKAGIKGDYVIHTLGLFFVCSQYKINKLNFAMVRALAVYSDGGYAIKAMIGAN